jgi:hypothetical protein
VLNLFARARSNLEFSILVSRFTTLRVTSLASRYVVRRGLSNTYPFRWMLTYHVREIQESTLDDLARFAEGE